MEKLFIIKFLEQKRKFRDSATTKTIHLFIENCVVTDEAKQFAAKREVK